MQVVIPFQNHEWNQLKVIAKAWTELEPKSSDSWYFLGLAEAGVQDTVLAKQHFNQAQELNARHLDAMVALSKIAYLESDLKTLEKLEVRINQLNEEQGQIINDEISSLKIH